ncbi:MAG: hypothetical protein JWR90_3257 [Marmoricola sp.]|jgi:hypothetical protein|nr:hypothetical protein [Marmoricola sp.]
MPAFLVELHRSGTSWQDRLPAEEQSGWEVHAAFMDALVDSGFVLLGGPVAGEHRVVLAVEAASEDDVHVVLAQDPWSGSHLQLVSLEPWRLRLDSRNRAF